MPLYTQQSLQMLVGLINQANPNLPVPLTTTNALYGTPAAVTPTGSNYQDTSIKVTAIASTKYVGNATLLYRRINLATLFRSLPIVIYKYTPAGTSASPYKISDLLPSINAKYGLALQVSDITDGSLPVGTTAAVPSIGLPAGTRNSSITVNAQAGSPGYSGSFTLYWVNAPQDISTMISVTSLESARAYPGGLSTVSSALYVIDQDTYSVDWTNQLNAAATGIGQSLATLVGWAAGQAIGMSGGNGNYLTGAAAVVAQVAAQTGKAYSATATNTTQFSLVGATWKSVTLPNAAVPEADSKYFNRALYLDLPAANTWGAGRMILHYNV